MNAIATMNVAFFTLTEEVIGSAPVNSKPEPGKKLWRVVINATELAAYVCQAGDDKAVVEFIKVVQVDKCMYSGGTLRLSETPTLDEICAKFMEWETAPRIDTTEILR